MVIFVEEGVGAPAGGRPRPWPRIGPRIGSGARGGGSVGRRAVPAHAGDAQTAAAAPAAAASDDAAAHVVLPPDLVDRVSGVGPGEALR